MRSKNGRVEGDGSSSSRAFICFLRLSCPYLVCFLLGVQVGNFSSTTTFWRPSSTTPPHQQQQCHCNCSSSNSNNNTIDDSQKELQRQRETRGKLLFFSNETRVLTSPSNQALEVQYPFVPPQIVEKCRLDKFRNNSKNNNTLQQQPLRHSIAYIKPHKTGSSTITGIVNHILYGRRDALKIIPADNTYLGWFPNQVFPGPKAEGLQNVLTQTRYDAFNNHAVFTNRTHLAQYLKEPLIVTTIIREPLSRTISAYNYFYPKLKTSWPEFIDTFKTLPTITSFRDAVAVNNLAFALGWYKQQHFHDDVRCTTKWDKNVTLIDQFISLIDTQFDLVMLLERLPESIVLLGEALPELDLSELVWLDYDGNEVVEQTNENKPKKDYPTDSERTELIDMLFLDLRIYDHFRQRFDQRWQEAVAEKPHLIKKKEALQCAHDMLRQSIDDLSVVPAITKDFFTLHGSQFSQLLRQRQHQKYGQSQGIQ